MRERQGSRDRGRQAEPPGVCDLSSDSAGGDALMSSFNGTALSSPPALKYVWIVNLTVPPPRAQLPLLKESESLRGRQRRTRWLRPRTTQRISRSRLAREKEKLLHEESLHRQFDELRPKRPTTPSSDRTRIVVYPKTIQNSYLHR
jgi:hypothetical protein